jgi:hypothetical protein
MKKGLTNIGFAFLITLSFLAFNTGYAANETPTFDCTLTDQLRDDKTAGDAKDTFITSTPMIYYICSSDEVTKGQSIKSVWVADNTHNAAPDNYKIDEKAMLVSEDLGVAQTFTTNFSISSPTAGWPIGSYHVDLYVDNKLIQTAKFTVK